MWRLKLFLNADRVSQYLNLLFSFNDLVFGYAA